MKKQLILASAVALLAMPTFSFAASMGNTTAGNDIACSSATGGPCVNSGQDFEFQPSPNVITLGNTTASTFAIAAYNESSLNADGGEAYGMASDISGVLTQDLSPPATGTKAAPVVTTTTVSDSGSFASPWLMPDGSAIAAQ